MKSVNSSSLPNRWFPCNGITGKTNNISYWQPHLKTSSNSNMYNLIQIVDTNFEAFIEWNFQHRVYYCWRASKLSSLSTLQDSMMDVESISLVVDVSNTPLKTAPRYPSVEANFSQLMWRDGIGPLWRHFGDAKLRSRRETHEDGRQSRNRTQAHHRQHPRTRSKGRKRQSCDTRKHRKRRWAALLIDYLHKNSN